MPNVNGAVIVRSAKEWETGTKDCDRFSFPGAESYIGITTNYIQLGSEQNKELDNLGTRQCLIRGDSSGKKVRKKG